MTHSLLAHVQASQDQAMKLNCVLEALEQLSLVEAPNPAAKENGMAVLIELGREMSASLYTSLDATNLPKD